MELDFECPHPVISLTSVLSVNVMETFPRKPLWLTLLKCSNVLASMLHSMQFSYHCFYNCSIQPGIHQWFPFILLTTTLTCEKVDQTVIITVEFMVYLETFACLGKLYTLINHIFQNQPLLLRGRVSLLQGNYLPS